MAAKYFSGRQHTRFASHDDQTYLKDLRQQSKLSDTLLVTTTRFRLTTNAPFGDKTEGSTYLNV